MSSTNRSSTKSQSNSASNQYFWAFENTETNTLARDSVRHNAGIYKTRDEASFARANGRVTRSNTRLVRLTEAQLRTMGYR